MEVRRQYCVQYGSGPALISHTPAAGTVTLYCITDTTRFTRVARAKTHAQGQSGVRTGNGQTPVCGPAV